MEKPLLKLCRKYKIAAFILFGSKASGKANRLSDIHIAYLPRLKLTAKQEDTLFLNVVKLFKRDDLDLVDLTKADITLKYAIINSGKLLACTSQKCLYNFVLKTRSVYLDTQYIRKVLAYYMNKRIEAGQFGG